MRILPLLFARSFQTGFPDDGEKAEIKGQNAEVIELGPTILLLPFSFCLLTFLLALKRHDLTNRFAFRQPVECLVQFIDRNDLAQ